MHAPLSRLLSASALAVLALVGTAVQAQGSAMPTPSIAEKPVRLRGTLVRVDANTLTLKERGG